jgi:hypothetical protein
MQARASRVVRLCPVDYLPDCCVRIRVNRCCRRLGLCLPDRTRPTASPGFGECFYGDRSKIHTVIDRAHRYRFFGMVHDLVPRALITVLVQLIAEFHVFHLVILHLSPLITITNPIYLKNPSEIINLNPLPTVIATTRLHACASTYLIFMLIHTPQLHIS